MTAVSDYLIGLRKRGIQVRVSTDEKIHINPTSSLADEDKDFLRKNRDEIVWLLRPFTDGGRRVSLFPTTPTQKRGASS